MVTSGAPHRISLAAATDGAVIEVDGEQLATIEPSGAAAAVQSHYFASAGTAPTGDTVLVDDVYFQ